MVSYPLIPAAMLQLIRSWLKECNDTESNDNH